MKTYRHVWLSPHLDDVALSGGGTVHRQSRLGQSALVITLFAGKFRGDQALSPLAARLHRSMGDVGALVAQRRREDREAMAVLGADLLWLDFQDAMYRGPAGRGHYAALADLFGPVHPDDLALVPAIADAVTAGCGAAEATSFYAPLAVGHHVDHQLARQVGELLARRGHRVVFYEDFPYSEPGYMQAGAIGGRAYSLDAVLAGESLTPSVTVLDQADVAARARAVSAYASQLSMLFGDPDAVPARISAHARHVGGDVFAERLWSIATDPE